AEDSSNAPTMPRYSAAFALMLCLPALGALAQEGQNPRPPEILVDVRMMSAAEVGRQYDVNTAFFQTAAGIFVAPAGLMTGVTAPADMRDSSNVAGNPNVQGTTTAQLGPPASVEFQSLQGGVAQVLGGSNFAAILREALKRRLQSAQFAAPLPRAVSVAVAFYGIQAKDGRPFMLEVDQDYCVVTAGAATLVDSAGPGSPTNFNASGNRSSGMADPICDTFSVLADGGGLRLRQLLYQTADYIADWLVINVLGGS
ncbi:MAG TPA: hypothetical protein VLC55_05075, partial [Burkholderiales bacterium]|nr:hypothetical protein [Burkholderiales bacterium]